MPGTSSSRVRNGWSMTLFRHETVEIPSSGRRPKTRHFVLPPTLKTFSSFSTCPSLASEMWQYPRVVVFFCVSSFTCVSSSNTPTEASTLRTTAVSHTAPILGKAYVTPSSTSVASTVAAASASVSLSCLDCLPIPDTSSGAPYRIKCGRKLTPTRFVSTSTKTTRARNRSPTLCVLARSVAGPCTFMDSTEPFEEASAT
mmetsp:Transcript_5165/g.19335  ORF Transcript_5165/g.19335 Transcript_5165/m.19335 type:complete len:200 (+) Transcript_5165:3530-4129(+)